MNTTEVLARLESLGTAQNRKVYMRHGVTGDLFGVSYATLGKLRKEIQVDQRLAEKLWETGNHDARVLATLIADPEQMTAEKLDAWVRDVDNYVLSDAFSGLAARSPAARSRLNKWIKSRGEWSGATGWNILAHLVHLGAEFDEDTLAGFLERIEEHILTSKNRVRHSMNGALISIGLLGGHLEKQAVAVAKRIGTVEVDHGQTGCKTPDAIAYIRRAMERRVKPGSGRKKSPAKKK